MTSSAPLSSSSSPDDQMEFEARPSHRVASMVTNIHADGDVWQEMLAVCEPPGKVDGGKKKPGGLMSLMGGGRGNNKPSGVTRAGSTSSSASASSSSKQAPPTLILRSYYENVRTGKRVWDEPPSGASKIVVATDEMRQMAQLQLQELVLSRSGAPPLSADSEENDEGTSTPITSSSSTKDASKKKGGLFGTFRLIAQAPADNKNNREKTDNGNANKQEKSRQINNLSSRRYRTNDVQLQEAIARSLADDGNNPTLTMSSTGEDDDDDVLKEQIELAKALSLSALEAAATSN